MSTHRPAALIKQGINELTSAGAQSPRAEARHLLAAAADLDPAGLATTREVDDAVADRYADLIRRRAAGEPVQYLTGRAWFRKIDVQVGPGVFIPRPETEAVVHFALDQLLNLRADTGPSPVIVDLGTGSGVIAKSILRVNTQARHACMPWNAPRRPQVGPAQPCRRTGHRRSR